jgi:hypothetical protein
MTHPACITERRMPAVTPLGGCRGGVITEFPPHVLLPDRVPERHASMLQSHVIDVDGTFVGAAVRLDRGYRFIATNVKLDDLDGTIFPSLAEVRRLARSVYLRHQVADPVRPH